MYERDEWKRRGIQCLLRLAVSGGSHKAYISKCIQVSFDICFTDISKWLCIFVCLHLCYKNYCS